MNSFDLIVIGSGPAGQRGAIQAAKLGKRVAIVERGTRVGGVSVHAGTIPSKTLREAVLYLTGWDQRGLYGRGYRFKDRLTVDDLMQRVAITLNHEVEVMQHQLQRNGVQVIEGEASFVDSHNIQVKLSNGSTEKYGAEKFLIAVGSRPHRPANIPFDEEVVIDSDGLLDIRRLPRSLVVVGAGVIGLEYASIFSTMDIKVTLVDQRATLLEFLEREVVDELIHHLRERGVAIRTEEKVDRVERDQNGRVITILDNGKRLCTDMVLFAAGRVGSTTALLPGNAGLTPDNRLRLNVNETFQTEAPHIYAAGDVIGFPALASTSMEQGRLAACHAFGKNACSSPEYFPYGIYAIPEISVSGKTEKELTDNKIPYEIGVARLRETARGQIMGLQDGLLKMLVSLEDRRLLGVHIIGENATELIHIGQAVMILGGTLDYFIDNVFNYPTLAEAYQVAALDAYNRIDG